MKTRSASKATRSARKGATPRTSASERPPSAAKATARTSASTAKRATPKAKRTTTKANSTKAKRATTKAKSTTTKAVKRATTGAKRATASVKRATATAKRATTKAAKRATATVKRAVSKVKRAAPKLRRAAARAMAPATDRERVRNLLERFSTVMLVTSEGSGAKATLQARPMAVARLDDDSTMTFLTSVESPQVNEARGNQVGHVIAQGRNTFLSLNGKIEVVRDRERIEAAWKPASQVWFPQGKDDPNLALMIFRPEHAEIWDASGTRGLKYLFEAARALVTGERPESDQHDTVDLRPAT